jgi:hypothetical protein
MQAKPISAAKKQHVPIFQLLATVASRRHVELDLAAVGERAD